MDIFHQNRKQNVNRIILPVLLALVLAGGVAAAPTIQGGSYDFGCVAIDFKVCHDFYFVNTTTKNVVIKPLIVACECSAIHVYDTLVEPGDSAPIRLEFDTGNLFGPTEKSFTISTTDPGKPIVEYRYTSNIGRWIFAIRPDPPSVFFLPMNKSKSLNVTNPVLDSISVALDDQTDRYYSVKISKATVAKGAVAQLEVVPTDGLKAGTYLSSFRLKIAPLDSIPSFYVSVPVKIVRY